MPLDFILSVMEANGELKTEGWCDLIYNFQVTTLAAVGEPRSRVKARSQIRKVIV